MILQKTLSLHLSGPSSGSQSQSQSRTKIVELIAECYNDLVSAASSAEAMENKSTVEGFQAAVKTAHKVRNNPKITELKAEVKSLEEGQ